MILRTKFVSGADIIVKESAIIDDTSDDLNIIFAGSGKTKSARPRLERIQNDHGPIDQGTEFFEAMNEVESKAIGGTGSDSNAIGQAGFLEGIHGFPDGFARIADPVGVMEQQQIEFAGAATRQFLLGSDAK